ncbi:hypothetical protein F511_04098 [Dorcoceras hygrometricum]|uniref:Uncharacterized protein n=1 Tax=Dorcoceras hygrometricum TaxID=472368 RepID=A0A2Z7D859_9LAMI|nr:hypothetical protein F511_04098 [Dorcoceras hygrometricum]
MSNTEHMQRCKAYTAARIISHAQFKAVKQAHIRNSGLTSYNYHKEVPSNTDLTPTKPNTDSSSWTVAQKLRIGSYELNQIFPTLLTQQKALNEAQEGRCLLTSPILTQASKICTKRSVSARAVQCYPSYFNRSCLPSAIGEDKMDPSKQKIQTPKDYEMPSISTKQLVQLHPTTPQKSSSQRPTGPFPPLTSIFIVTALFKISQNYLTSPRPETGFLRQPALEGLTRSARTDSPRQDWPETSFPAALVGGGGGGGFMRRGGAELCLGLGLA